MTDAHRKVLRQVEGMGHRVMDEVPFPPFQVDIYVPDSHAAIEVDGPHHEKKRDMKRDHILLERYLLPVLHIPVDLSKWQTAEMVTSFLGEHREDAQIRFRRIQDELPWL